MLDVSIVLVVQPLRVLITGGRGKVGRRAAHVLSARGHHVTIVDIAPAKHGPATAGELPYLHGDLTDFGVAVGVIVKSRPDVIVHAAGIPGPSHDAQSVIFQTNAVSTFNVVEAAVRLNVPRVIYISSETTVGYITAERAATPDYVPVDELHPLRPQDAYALSKGIGEAICDAAVRRSDVSAVSIRPSIVLDDEDYPLFIPRYQANPAGAKFNLWSYVDVGDLADLIALAAESDTDGHEVVYAAALDNSVGIPLAELVDRFWPEDERPAVRAVQQVDASFLDTAKAQRLFGWTPTRSWRNVESFSAATATSP